MTKKQVKIQSVLIVLLLLAYMLISGWFILPAFADTEQYTGVLEDLQKDLAFNISDWDNTQLHPDTELMQIAESTDRQLFIYIHMVGDDKAFEKIVFNTSMMFSELDFCSYEMELVSNESGFYKYFVKDYKTPQDNYHTYSITRLEYPVDSPVQGTQQKTYEYYPVEQIWTVRKNGNNVEYSYEYLKTIKIIDKHVDSNNHGVYHDSWFGQYESWTDTFYIAFSTDLLMENLIEAQIEYTMNVTVGNGKIISYGDSTKPINVVVNCDEVSQFEQDTHVSWWFVSWKTGTEKRSFKSILKPDDFKNKTGITVPKRKDGTSYDWVVTFFNHTQTWDYPGSKVTSWVVPGDATILRLKFETDGVCYNLGVLDNRTSYIPPKFKLGESMGFWQYVWSCVKKLFNGTADFIETVVAVAAIFVVVALLPVLLFIFSLIFPSLGAALKTILKAIGKALLWFLKGLWWIISAPFKLIVYLFKGGGKT